MAKCQMYNNVNGKTLVRIRHLSLPYSPLENCQTTNVLQCIAMTGKNTKRKFEITKQQQKSATHLSQTHLSLSLIVIVTECQMPIAKCQIHSQKTKIQIGEGGKYSRSIILPLLRPESFILDTLE